MSLLTSLFLIFRTAIESKRSARRLFSNWVCVALLSHTTICIYNAHFLMNDYRNNNGRRICASEVQLKRFLN